MTRTLHLILIFLTPFSLLGQTVPLKTKMSVVIDYQFSEANQFSDGMAAVKIYGRWGYINKKGQKSISGSYTEAKPFDRGIAAVKKEGLWYFIDKKGKIISPEGYDKVNYLDAYAKVKKNRKWGALTFDMEPLIPIKHKYFLVYNDSFIETEKPNPRGAMFNWKGILNFAGDTIIPPKYSLVKGSEGFFICINEKLEAAFFNTKGEQLTDFKYNGFLTEKFENGRAIVHTEAEGAYLIDTDFKALTKGFESLFHGYGTKYAATLNGKDGIYDVATQSWVTEPQYASLFYQEKDHWRFEMKGGLPTGVINEKGEVLFESATAEIDYMDLGVITLEEGSKQGFYCLATGFQSEIKYKSVWSYEEGSIIMVEEASGWSALNAKGKVLASNLQLGYMPNFKEGLLAVPNKSGKWGYVRFD